MNRKAEGAYVTFFDLRDGKSVHDAFSFVCLLTSADELNGESARSGPVEAKCSKSMSYTEVGLDDCDN